MGKFLVSGHSKLRSDCEGFIGWRVGLICQLAVSKIVFHFSQAYEGRLFNSCDKTGVVVIAFTSSNVSHFDVTGLRNTDLSFFAFAPLEQ